MPAPLRERLVGELAGDVQDAVREILAGVLACAVAASKTDAAWGDTVMERESLWRPRWGWLRRLLRLR